MKSIKTILVFTFILFSFKLRGQEVKCDDLIDFVKGNGIRKGEVGYFELMKSSWLNQVKAYKIDNIIVVVAEIKTDQFGINTKEYVFCNISSWDWDAFYYGLYDSGSTYGERFNKYIMNYRCDCY